MEMLNRQLDSRTAHCCSHVPSGQNAQKGPDNRTHAFPSTENPCCHIICSKRRCCLRSQPTKKSDPQNPRFQSFLTARISLKPIEDSEVAIARFSLSTSYRSRWFWPFHEAELCLQHKKGISCLSRAKTCDFISSLAISEDCDDKRLLKCRFGSGLRSV